MNSGIGSIGQILRDSSIAHGLTAYSSVALTAASGPISGADTVQLLPPTTLSLADTVFNTDSLWVGIRVRITTNVGPAMTGRFRITTLGLRIVVQDKVF